MPKDSAKSKSATTVKDTPGPKNIIICLDGTGNEIEENISNVLKIYLTLRSIGGQPVYYSQGVGTLVEVRPWSRMLDWFRDKLLGNLFGYGLDRRVQEAYRFIVRHYEPGDHIFIFGYSRGAYMARILAGMIHAVGVLKPNQDNLVGAAYAAYLAKPKRRRPTYSGENVPDLLDKDDGEEEESEGEAAPAEEVRSAKAVTFRRVTQAYTVPVHFLGLFDTVASVMAPGFRLGSPFPLTLNPYPHTFLNESVRRVRHAISIDERRQFFPVSLWPADQKHRTSRYVPDEQAPEQDLEEVWFSGAHGDVGGGNIRDDSGLSQIPLNWMMKAATEPTELQSDIVAELKLNGRMLRYVTGEEPYNAHTEYLYPEADSAAKLHPSFAGWKGVFWYLFELVPTVWPKVIRMGNYPHWLRLGLGSRRKLPPEAMLHKSVYERIKQRPDYRPSNIDIGKGA